MGEQFVAQLKQAWMLRQRQGKAHLRQGLQLVQQHRHQPRFSAVAFGVVDRQQTELLDQLARQWRDFQHPALPRCPASFLTAHIQAAHLGLHRGHHLVFNPRRNPDAPLRRREVAALGGVHPQHTTDRVGELHPVMLMTWRPGAGPEAFRPRI
ncbi:hypothetical protein D3C75_899500 [compost metagenome]